MREAQLAPREIRFPGGWDTQVTPFAILGGAAIFLGAEWNRIPERFPVHWTLTGQPNGWGLVNDVGNAQEWVKGPKGLEVRGGSYKDSLSQCSVSLTHGSDGKPDQATGFRLVRSLQRAH